MRTNLFLAASLALASVSFARPAPTPTPAASTEIVVKGGPELVVQERNGLPLTEFQITFRVGSAHDPRNQLGIASLTAALVRQGGVKAMGRLPSRSRAELEDALFPLAADIDVSVHKEQTTFSVSAPAADAERIFEFFAQMVLSPALSADEFNRLKHETLDSLQKQWPNEDQEELGKAVLDASIYGPDHPYSHVDDGTVATVKAIDLAAVRDFYRKHYTLSRLFAGVSGVVTPSLRAKVESVLKRLPVQGTPIGVVPPAPTQEGLSLTLVKGSFEAVGVHIGFPIAATRGSAEFPSLYLSAMGLGKHRSFVGRLMKVVREERGLNYGAYAYAEDFPNGGSRLTEPTQAARSRQAFTLWGRPTPVENGCFLLKQMYRELSRFSEKGLSEEEFTLTQSHLVGTIPMLSTSLDRQLGYALDGLFYGMGTDPLAGLLAGVKAAKRKDVNEMLKKRITWKDARLVVTTPDPERFQKELASEQCTIQYAKGISKGSDVLSEDKEIGKFPVPVAADRIRVVAADDFFRGSVEKPSRTK